MNETQVQKKSESARADAVGAVPACELDIRRDRRRAGLINADVDAVTRNHLTVQPWQTATLQELLEMMEETKTAPTPEGEARYVSRPKNTL